MIDAPYHKILKSQYFEAKIVEKGRKKVGKTRKMLLKIYIKLPELLFNACFNRLCSFAPGFQLLKPSKIAFNTT